MLQLLSLLIFTTFPVSNVFGKQMSQEELAVRQHLALKFLDDNEQIVRKDSLDEAWMSNFLAQNSLHSQPKPELSDPLSPNLQVLSDTVGTAPCASGWTRFEKTGNCYKESEWMMSWYDGEDYCWNERAGGHLASVHSEEEAVWLHAQYKQLNYSLDDWIGLRRACDNVTYYWTDGSPVDFQWWQPRYPKAAFAEESCVTIWDTTYLHLKAGYVPGQFDDMKNCGDPYSNAICMYNPNSAVVGEPFAPQRCTTPGEMVQTTKALTSSSSKLATITTTTTSKPGTSVTTNLCAPKWTYYSKTGNCYRETDWSYSWYNAEDWCWNNHPGAHLASVHSQEEAVWIHATFKQPEYSMDDWIGLRRACDNVTYYWTDGTPFDFIWWQPRYPKSKYAEESCVTIWDIDYLHSREGYVPGQFDDMKNCGDPYSYAICMYNPNKESIGEPYSPQKCTTPGEIVPTTKPLTTTTTPPITTTKLPFNPSLCPSKCPTNWVFYNNKCYTKLQGTGSVITSSSECVKLGGSLASISDMDMNEALRKAFSTNNAVFEQAWIATSTFTNFAEDNQPNGGWCYAMALSQENSGTYVQRGFWRTYPCTDKLDYVICEKAL